MAMVVLVKANLFLSSFINFCAYKKKQLEGVENKIDDKYEMEV